MESKTTVRDNQFGFISGRQTADAIFTLRHTMEMIREKWKNAPSRVKYLSSDDIEPV